jgi:Protein of unknown function (DUF3575)
MRVLFSICGLMLFCCLGFSQNNSQDTTQKSFHRKYIAKLDLLAPAARTFQLQLERTYNKSNSLCLGLLYSDQTEAITNAAFLYRFAATLENRYYLSKMASPKGFYLSTFVRYQWMRTDDWVYNYLYDATGNYIYINQYVTRKLNTFGLGINLGYQAVFKDRIALDVYLGPVYNTGDKRVNLNNPYEYRPNESFKPYVGYFVRAGLAIGYCF